MLFRLVSDSYANFDKFDSPLVQLFSLNFFSQIVGHRNFDEQLFGERKSILPFE